MPCRARFLELPVCFAPQLVALGLLRADVQKTDARALHTEHLLGIVAAQVRELQQVLHRAFRIRAAVDQHRLARRGGDRGRKRRAAKTADALDDQRCPGKERARAARADKAVRLTVAQKVQAHGEGGILLLLEGGGGIVADLDHLLGVDDLDAGGKLLPAALAHRAQDILRPAGEYDLRAVPLMCQKRALDRRKRSKIAAHCVYDDLHAVSPFLFFDVL